MHKENTHQVSEPHVILSKYLLGGQLKLLNDTLKIDINYNTLVNTNRRLTKSSVFPILSGHAHILLGLLTLFIDALNI